MVTKFHIRSTEDTPEILLDPTHKRFEIKGNSNPDDAVGFYMRIVSWFEHYVEERPDHETVTMKFHFRYLNTSTNKMCFEILEFMDDYNEHHSERFHIHWYYDDEDLMEAGQDLKSSLYLPFELIKVQ